MNIIEINKYKSLFDDSEYMPKFEYYGHHVNKHGQIELGEKDGVKFVIIPKILITDAGKSKKNITGLSN